MRAQNIVERDDREAFAVVWYPGPFLPLDIAPAAMANACRALVPGGWLVFGIFSPPPDPLGEAIAALRIVCCGGHPWQTADVEDRLRGLGLEQVETYGPKSGATLTIGRKPD